MNEKKSPSSDWQAERTDGAQLFQAFLGGGGREPAVARLLFLLPFSLFPAHLPPPPSSFSFFLVGPQDSLELSAASL